MSELETFQNKHLDKQKRKSEKQRIADFHQKCDKEHFEKNEHGQPCYQHFKNDQFLIH